MSETTRPIVIRSPRDVVALVNDGIAKGGNEKAITLIALGGIFIDAYDFTSLAFGLKDIANQPVHQIGTDETTADPEHQVEHQGRDDRGESSLGKESGDDHRQEEAHRVVLIDWVIPTIAACTVRRR